jgi:hypothetical protein
LLVIPAKARIQFDFNRRFFEKIKMDPGFRRDDGEVIQSFLCASALARTDDAE